MTWNTPGSKENNGVSKNDDMGSKRKNFFFVTRSYLDYS